MIINIHASKYIKIYLIIVKRDHEFEKRLGMMYRMV